MEFFWAVVIELFFGIVPEVMASRMEAAAAETCAWLVSGPGPLVLPVAWQVARLQLLCMIGLTFNEKDLSVNVLQSNVPFPLSSSLVQDRRFAKIKMNSTERGNSFFIMKEV